MKVKAKGFLGGSDAEESACNAADAGLIPGSGREEERMAIHSSILAWRILLTEEHSGLQFMGLQRVGHNRVTNTFTNTPMYTLSTTLCCLLSIYSMSGTKLNT